MGSQAPPISVGYCEPMWPGDSGLTILFSDSPDRLTEVAAEQAAFEVPFVPLAGHFT